MEPFSIAASVGGVVGLADVICRLGKELYSFYSTCKNSSQEIQHLVTELQQLDTIIQSIRKIAQTYQTSAFATDDGLALPDVLETLQNCQSEYEVLLDLAEGANPAKFPATARGIYKKVKWVLDEKKVVRACQKLERVKSTLAAALSNTGRYSRAPIAWRLSLI